jgi:hypothetical protein
VEKRFCCSKKGNEIINTGKTQSKPSISIRQLEVNEFDLFAFVCVDGINTFRVTSVEYF